MFVRELKERGEATKCRYNLPSSAVIAECGAYVKSDG